MDNALDASPFNFQQTKRLLLSIAITAAIGLGVISAPAEAAKAAPAPKVAAAFSATWSLPFSNAEFAT